MEQPKVTFWKKLLHKLSSRKLWAAITAFTCTVMLSMGADRMPAETILLLEKGIVALCVYIGGESLVDAAAIFQKD